MIITVLKQSNNTPAYARIRISEKNSGKQYGLLNVNAGTYWETPKYPDGSYIVEVLEVSPAVKCEVRAQNALVGVYFDPDNRIRICAASQRDYSIE